MPDLLESQDSRGRDRALNPAAGITPARSRDTQRQEEGAERAVLSLKRVSKWYGPVIGVNEVTLHLHSGVTGLVGANGAGKSTLLRLAAGHLRPDLGSVRVRGVEAWKAGARWFIGYCPDLDTFYEDMSGRQLVEAMASLYGYPRPEARRRTAEALELVGMIGRSERRVQGYSKGMRQRIKLAQALVHDPQLIILDEPLRGIDPVGRQELIVLFNLLAEQGRCLLVSSHELGELEKLTNQVVVMARGRIAAAGTLAEIRELLEDRPLSVLVKSEGARKLAAVLIEMPEVGGVELDAEDRLIVRVRHPRQFFQKLTALIIEESLEVQRLETLDESAQAILGYLLEAQRA